MRGGGTGGGELEEEEVRTVQTLEQLQRCNFLNNIIQKIT